MKQRADLNGEYAISLGAAGDRVKILLDTGVEMALKPENLRKVDVFPGARVSIVGLKNAAHLNGMVPAASLRNRLSSTFLFFCFLSNSDLQRMFVVCSEFSDFANLC